MEHKPEKAHVIKTLCAHEAEIRALGVRKLSLFGSVARDTANKNSDIDVLIEFDPELKSYDNFLRLSELLEKLLGHRVELVTKESLSPFIGPHILAEASDVLHAA